MCSVRKRREDDIIYVKCKQEFKRIIYSVVKENIDIVKCKVVGLIESITSPFFILLLLWNGFNFSCEYKTIRCWDIWVAKMLDSNLTTKVVSDERKK